MNIAQGTDHAFFKMTVFLRKIPDERLHPLPFLIADAADRAGAADDREILFAAEADDIPLFDENEGTDHGMPSIVGLQFRTHRLEASNVKLIEQKGLDKIVEMMPEGDLVATELVGQGVKDATAQAGAERTVGCSGPAFFLDDLVTVGRLHAMLEAMFVQMPFNHLLAKAGEARIDIHRHQLVADGSPAAQRIENMQQGVGVLAAGDADGDPVAVLDQTEITDRLADHFLYFPVELTVHHLSLDFQEVRLF